MIKKIRLWLAIKILGDIQLINNVKIYQTLCINMGECVNLNGVHLDLGHKLDWVGKDEAIGVKLDYYQASIDGTYEEIMEKNSTWPLNNI